MKALRLFKSNNFVFVMFFGKVVAAGLAATTVTTLWFTESFSFGNCAKERHATEHCGQMFYCIVWYFC